MPLIGACLIGIGTIASVATYWTDVPQGFKDGVQVISLGLMGVGTMFGFWAVLLKAGERGLFLEIVGGFLCVIIVLLVAIYRARTGHFPTPTMPKLIIHKHNKRPSKDNPS